jgi:GT2 family glycosyltransferase
MTARASAHVERDSKAHHARVLAIVVTHNGRRWFKDCLIALNAQTYPSLDVLVVDDATPDGREQPSLRRVAKRHLRRRRWGFLRTRLPQGFGGAINWALSRVRTDAEMLLFLHDDAVLDATAVERLVARLGGDDDTAIVGPKIVGWDDPRYLEEVGMAVDRFGYPYKGLDEGEIDLGQHDVATEVFFVTSTCMLVRHDVFKQLRGWDARMRAFSEDLDLCWRARVGGHLVVVEPKARVRHAIALATGQRASRFTPARYYIRRNRLRTVAKNVSTLRLVALVPQFVLLAFSEMLGFIVLRQPAEIVNLLRALAWNLFTAPQTLSERLRVQRDRRVGDRRMRRLMVRETTRLHAYVSHQTERLEQAWGRSTELVAERSTRAAALSRNLGAWHVSAAAVVLLAVVLGWRHFLWSPPAAVGDLVPFPPGSTALWRAWAAPWQPVELGRPGPAPPAFLVLGMFPVAALGAVGVAQKLLVGVFGLVAFWGAYRLVSEVADRPARVGCGLAYVFGPLGYAGLRTGDLGALAFGAVAPFVLHALLSATGWVGRAGADPARTVARIALGCAIAAAFVPGSLVLLAFVCAVVAVLRMVLGPKRRAATGLGVGLLGIALAWVLLLPWSATWLEPGGLLRVLLQEEPAAYARRFSGHGAVGVLLGRTPEGPGWFGLALPLLAAVALLAGAGQRRRLALALAGVVVAGAWFVSAVASGLIGPLVATPTAAGVLPAAGWAGLAGLAVGAFRLDLPRRRLGLMQAAGVAGLCIAAALLVVGLAPALWRGEWQPGRGTAAAGADVIAQIDSLLRAEAPEGRAFRVLWVGDEWSAGAAPVRDHLLTTSGARVLSDLFATPVGPGAAALGGVIASVEQGTTDAAGHALGAFNVRFVVVARAPGAHRWLGQRDLALVRSADDFTLLENGSPQARAAAYTALPRYVDVLATGDSSLGAGAPAEAIVTATRRSASTYTASQARGPGVVWLAESRNEGWRAFSDDEPLSRTEGGWGNAFALPGDATGRLSISYRRGAADVAWLLAFGLVWIVVLGAAIGGIRMGSTSDGAL